MNTTTSSRPTRCDAWRVLPLGEWVSQGKESLHPDAETPARGRGSCPMERIAYALRRCVKPNAARPGPDTQTVVHNIASLPIAGAYNLNTLVLWYSR